MSRTVRWDTLRSQIQYLADAQALTARHTPADLLRAGNQSIQHFREKVSATGSRNYLVNSNGTTASGPTSPFAFTVLDLGAATPAVVRVFGLDMLIDGRVIPLEHVGFESRNDFQDIVWGSGNFTGQPMAFANYQQAKLAIFPATDAVYNYTAWYLPVLADLVADSDTFDGVVGWEEWVAWDVLIKMIQRDQYPQAYATAERERDRLWADIERNCNPAKTGGLVRRVDTRELRLDRFRRRGNWWNL